MKVHIIDTDEDTEIACIDLSSGFDVAAEIIGAHGALADGQFRRDPLDDGYRCTRATYDWWTRVLADQQRLEARLYNLRAEHGDEAVGAVLADLEPTDLEYTAGVANDALDEVFGKEAAR